MDIFFIKLIEAVEAAFRVKTGNLLEININEEIPNNVDLSSLIRNALFIHNDDLDVWNDIEVKVILRNHFDIMELDNKFPNKVSFYFCHGQYLTIKENQNNTESDVKSSYYFYSTSLTKLEIQCSLNNFDSEHISVTDFNIFNLNNKPIIFEDIEIHGSVNNIAIRNVVAKRVNFDLTNTIGVAQKINVHFQYFNPKYLYFQSRTNIDIIYQIGIIPKFVLILHRNAGLIRVEEIDCEHFDIEHKQGIISELAFKRIRGLKTMTLTGHQHDGVINQIDNFYFNSINLNKDFSGVIEYFRIVKVFAMFNIVNQGLIRLTDVDLLESDVRVGKSRLGFLSFLNSKVPNIISVNSSSIEDIRFAGSTVPRKFKSIGESDSSIALNNEIQIVQQMKSVMEKSGDKELSKFFRYEELRLRYKKNILFNRSEFEEKITLWFNFSNNHGQSWVKPTSIALLITGPIIFSLFLYSIGYRVYFSKDSFETFCNLWSHYFDIIIPSYLYPSKNKLAFLENFVGKENNELWKLPTSSQFLILINDIIIMPYLIIQAISAFRKHVT